MYDEDFRLRLSTHHVGPASASAGTIQTSLDHRRDAHNVALIGDPRNDENAIVAQVHQAFTQFHNRILDNAQLMNGVDGRSERFRRASRLARWHYQWVVLHDYLKRVCQPEIYRDIVNPGGTPRRRLYPKPDEVAAFPYMPIEFAGAAYRFGDSMVRPSYALNSAAGTQQSGHKRIPIFDGDGAGSGHDLRGFRRMPTGHGIDWGYFLELPGHAPAVQLKTGTLQPLPDRYAARRSAAAARQTRSDGACADRANLAYLNLLRGSRLRLPTAEQVGEAMNVGSFAAARFLMLTPDQIWSAGSRNSVPFDQETGDEGIDAARDAFGANTPLWYYILREAEWYGTWDAGDTDATPARERGKKDTMGGHHFGPIGSTIVLGTFVALLLGDPGSFILQAGWRPMAPIAGSDPDAFELKDLITFALG